MGLQQGKLAKVNGNDILIEMLLEFIYLPQRNYFK